MLNLNFRVPSVEVVAVLWPGVDVVAHPGEQAELATDLMDELPE